VLFFLGAPPTVDGKAAPGSRVVAAAGPNAAGAYTAQLPLPDQVGPVPVGVRFVNNVGLAKDVLDEVVVTEPPPKPTTGSIKVTVTQGSPPLPQSGLGVQLRDAANKNILKPGATNDKGEFTFTEVAPGQYIVYSERPSDRTKAQMSVTVEAGKTADAPLELRRQR